MTNKKNIHLINKLKSKVFFVFSHKLTKTHNGETIFVTHKKFEVANEQIASLYTILITHNDITNIRPNIDDFITFAKKHTESHFLSTHISYGITRLSDKQIVFSERIKMKNVLLHES